MGIFVGHLGPFGVLMLSNHITPPPLQLGEGVQEDAMICSSNEENGLIVDWGLELKSRSRDFFNASPLNDQRLSFFFFDTITPLSMCFL
jgi:hypothetical protein